jgi:hypothetical protein
MFMDTALDPNGGDDVEVGGLFAEVDGFEVNEDSETGGLGVGVGLGEGVLLGGLPGAGAARLDLEAQFSAAFQVDDEVVGRSVERQLVGGGGADALALRLSQQRATMNSWLGPTPFSLPRASPGTLIVCQE